MAIPCHKPMPQFTSRAMVSNNHREMKNDSKLKQTFSLTNVKDLGKSGNNSKKLTKLIQFQPSRLNLL
jgi:hypothetical protein